jgi:hypothetical protein
MDLKKPEAFLVHVTDKSLVWPETGWAWLVHFADPCDRVMLRMGMKTRAAAIKNFRAAFKKRAMGQDKTHYGLKIKKDRPKPALLRGEGQWLLQWFAASRPVLLEICLADFGAQHSLSDSLGNKARLEAD